MLYTFQNNTFRLYVIMFCEYPCVESAKFIYIIMMLYDINWLLIMILKLLIKNKSLLTCSKGKIIINGKINQRDVLLAINANKTSHNIIIR